VDQESPPGSSSVPLIGNPKREAADSGRGFIYQYWQTIWRWIRLEANEALFIEKAEDFDVVADEKAEVTEVKDTAKSGKVTLNSRNVLDAICNFWEIKLKNPEFQIDFAFLTTSERGHERTNDFGGQKGIDVWDACKFDQAQLGALRRFLVKKQIAHASLADFIRSSSDEDFQERLVRRINWDTGKKPFDSLQKLITEQVSCTGESRGVPRWIAVKVVPFLFQNVCDLIAGSGDRRLHRDDFLQIFEEQTTARVPLGGSQTAAEMGGIAFRALQPTSTRPVCTSVRVTPPTLPTGLSRRDAVIRGVSPKLRSGLALVLKGSTGMGKSTLANLLLIAGNAPHCRWIDLRGLTGEEIRLLLHQETFMSRNPASGSYYVLDDLNVGSGFSAYENNLVEFCCAILSRGGPLIITTQTGLPPNLLNRISLSSEVELQVPPLVAPEIEEVLLNFGCENEKRRIIWGLVIQGQTHGHPQLVLAMARRLQAESWPEPIGPTKKLTDLSEVRREARRLLRENLPSEPARTLAFRLSLLSQPFRRDHALSIAKHPPSVALPGEAFDLLVGPWIEQEGEGYFRISPLLESAAAEVWPKDEVTKLHLTVAEGILNCGQLTYLEASIILQHGIEAGAPSAVLPIASFFAHERGAKAGKIAPYFSWFVGTKLGPDEVLLPNNIALSSFLRASQFEFACELSPKGLAPLVAQRWEDEIARSRQADLAVMNRCGFLVATVVRMDVPFPTPVLIQRVLEASKLLEDSDAQPFFPKHLPLPDGEDLDATETLFTFVLGRCSGVCDVMELFQTLAKLPEPDLKRLLTIFDKHERWSSVLFGKVYLAEEAKPQPQWELCIVSLELIATLCAAWKSVPLIATCYASIAVIQDEYLHDPHSALASVAAGKHVLGSDNAVLENENAMILYRQEKYGEALSILEKILPSWHSGNASVAFAIHKAETCAARLGKWERAVQLALDGQEEAERQRLKNMAIGFRAARAWALWKCGKRGESVKAFASTLQALPEKPNAAQDFRGYALFRQVGHAIAWLLQHLQHCLTLQEPPPGWFTLADIDERIKDDPVKPSDFAWFLLAQIEFQVTSDQTVFKELERRAAQCGIGAIEFGVEHLRLRRCLQTGKLAPLLRIYDAYLKAFERAKETFARDFDKLAYQPEIDRFCSKTLAVPGAIELLDLLFAALVLATLRGRRPIPLSEWKVATNAHQAWRDSWQIGVWLDFVAADPVKNLKELKTAVGEHNNYLWSVGALLLCVQEGLPLYDRLFASMALVDAAAHSLWRSEIERDVEKLVVSTWSKAASPSERFNLVSPATSAPKIIQAAGSEISGLRKAALVLLAAREAVRAFLPDNLVSEINSLARPKDEAPVPKESGSHLNV
jgi:tetratricopeptide (TPR) repeat protein